MISSKSNILIVGNYNRKDVVDSFIPLTSKFNIYFIDFTSPKEVYNNYYMAFGTAIFWGDFKSAQDLITQIRPHKVVFYFIESYFHMALNLACKESNITSIVIDHGLRDANINTRLAVFFTNHKKKSFSILRGTLMLTQFRSRIKARLFLIRTSLLLSGRHKIFLSNFIKIRSKFDYATTILKLNSTLCLPDQYISFSKKNKRGHFPFYHFPKQCSTFTIGIPLFDPLYYSKATYSNPKKILFIDQGLNNRNLLGWNDHNYLSFLTNLSQKTITKGLKIYIKLHPTQTLDKTVLHTLQNFELIDDIKLQEVLLETSLVIGFFSTYLLPLIAFKHTTVLTLENHPIGKLDVSKSFIDAGVVHPIYTLRELEDALENVEQLHKQQLPNKAKFTADWMYKFDGKAGERLRTILLSSKV